MYKKLLLIGLISLIPVQAWAVLDMSMQKQIASTVSPIHAPASIHPCHQDGNDAIHHSMNDQQAVEVMEIDASHVPCSWPLVYFRIRSIL